MGDAARHREFARFIRRTFPKAKSALVVADGKGQLARKLANAGISCRVIENSPRFVGRQHPLINYQKGFFVETDSVTEDIIVGMHPDEATGEIVLAANRYNRPFAIVPCCIVGKASSGVRNFVEWCKKLKQLGGSDTFETSLKFSGKNTVIYRRRK